MLLVTLLVVLAVSVLLYINRYHGFQQTLAAAAFLLIIFPEECKISLAGVFYLTTQRIVILTLLLLTVIDKKLARSRSQKLPLHGAIVAMAIWWIISTMTSAVFSVSLKAVISQVLDYFVVYYLFATYVSSLQTIRHILFGLVAGVAVCSVFGVLEAYLQWTVMSLFPVTQHYFGVSGNLYIDHARGLRVQSTLGHPILFGTALMMAIPMALYLVTTTRKTVLRVFLWTATLLMFACIYKTSSRGPWLALALSFALLGVFGPRTIRNYLATLCLLAAFVLVIRPGVLESLANSYLSTVDSTSYLGESYQYRYGLYDVVLQELNRSVLRSLFGYGPESFFFLTLVGTLNGRTMVYRSCDSSIAALLIETGYVGFSIAATLLCSALLKTGVTFKRLRTQDRYMFLVLFANQLGFIFLMASVAIFRWGQPAAMFWIVVAMAMAYPRIVGSSQGSRAVRTPDTAPGRPNRSRLVAANPSLVHGRPAF